MNTKFFLKNAKIIADKKVTSQRFLKVADIIVDKKSDQTKFSKNCRLTRRFSDGMMELYILYIDSPVLKVVKEKAGSRFEFVHVQTESPKKKPV